MIELVIFDLDGVLVETRELHYESLNSALSQFDKKYVIGKDEHLSKYDGLNTTKKLQMLEKEKGLPFGLHHSVWLIKQNETSNLVRKLVPNPTIVETLSAIKKKNIKIAVASNSIRESVKLMLIFSGLIEFVDYYISNEDVKNPKPHPEMYMKAMLHFNCSPKNTLVVEDSHIGRKAAYDSGANVMGVKNSHDVTPTTILNVIDSYSSKQKSTAPKWQGGKMKILIPMAGAGSRFEKAGFTFPKPLIEVFGEPMIKMVVDNINIDAEHVFIVRKDHYDKYNLRSLLNIISPLCKIVVTEGITEGAACTTLLAEQYINDDSPLLIANSDQWIDWNSNEFMYSSQSSDIDGSILTFKNTHPKWSYVILDENGFVKEVREKEVVSNVATVGIYYWSKGSDYVKYAKQMIDKDVRVNNEFYVAPVYNEAIADGKKIKTFNVNCMFGTGTPEDLDLFIKSSAKV